MPWNNLLHLACCHHIIKIVLAANCIKFDNHVLEAVGSSLKVIRHKRDILKFYPSKGHPNLQILYIQSLNRMNGLINICILTDSK